MHMILAHLTLHNPDLKCFERLPDQLANTLSNITSQNPVAILRQPNKVVLNPGKSMTTLAVINGKPSVQRLIV
jgi:hypothetical protein